MASVVVCWVMFGVRCALLFVAVCCCLLLFVVVCCCLLLFVLIVCCSVLRVVGCWSLLSAVWV